jgi:hypothetical protein
MQRHKYGGHPPASFDTIKSYAIAEKVLGMGYAGTGMILRIRENRISNAPPIFSRQIYLYASAVS